ncbi:MAG: DUF1573 domain-containing protein [Deltaproteobacteria bacterium]|jgi:hypothetical protein|nr:DUF1573 domain-containing protein [Deltaproteobacteria bacterium]MDH4007784.1 DUF1573 domain-containing protein [Desulfuromonadales bacterium]
MRTIVCTVVVFLIGLYASLACAAPDMAFTSTQFDFGKVFQGDKVLHTFEFVNAGQDPLLIDRVRSSCGCTAVLVSEKNLAPGAKGQVQANFDSARFRGTVSKTIYLYSNDPVKPVMQLKIKGEVIEIVAVEPEQVNFGTVAGDQTLVSKVVFRNQGENQLTLGKPSTTAIELQAEMSETILAKGEEITLELMLSPKPGTTRFSGYVLVPVDGVPKNQLRIPVYAVIRK